MREGEGLLYNDPKQLTKKRGDDEVNKPIMKGIETISKNIDNIVPFGSWTYKSQLYPGDIDLIELEQHCCDIKEATKKFVKDTKKIVKKIKKSRGYYLGDIKAGIDISYLIDIGEIGYDREGRATIKNYNPEYIKHQIEKKLVLTKIIPEKTLIELLRLIKNEVNQEEYEKLYTYLRDKWLLRWSEQEILKGNKQLDGKRKITLGQAINMPTMTKIDMWTNINGTFIEFSNVLTYFLVDKQGNKRLLNFQNDIRNLVNDLKYEVQKYAFSEKDFRPYKMLKRMWSIARMTKDEKMLSIITPLMQTDLGRLSQMSSEMETLINILEKVKTPPIPTIMKQLDNYKWKLGNVFEVDINTKKMIDEIKEMMKHNKNRKADKEYLKENLTNIRKYINGVVADVTIEELRKIGLYPPPKSYLPEEVRGGCETPWDPSCPKYIKKGSSLLTKAYQKAANIYRGIKCGPKSRKLYEGELHPGCYNYCGPGTKIEREDVRGTNPIDEIDNICRDHDIDYLEANEKPDKKQLIRKADRKMLERLEQHKNMPGYSLAKTAISGKIQVENLLKDVLKDKFNEHLGSD